MSEEDYYEEWVREQQRPMDWQDRTVIAGSLIVGLLALVILFLGVV